MYVHTEHNGIVDVSDDLVTGTLVRRSDGVSTFSFSLQNARRKYDRIFTPNDRIAVQMKRLQWVQVFTGYLNSVPLVTAWPRVVNLTASCSLKRLQYWYWDSYSEASQLMVNQALIDARKDSGISDGGMTNVILTILKKVVGWPEHKVHIARIPDNWFKVVEKLAKQVNDQVDAADKQVRQMLASIGGSSIGGSSGAGGVSNVLNGAYAGETFPADGLRNAETIYNVGRKRGSATETITAALMAAIQESTLGSDPNSKTPNLFGNVGIFQMRPGNYWGSLAQVTDVATAAERWFKEWDDKVGPTSKLTLGQQCEKVEVSGMDPEATYGRHQRAAAAMVSAMSSSPGGTSPGTSSLTSRPMGATSGLVLAQTAVDLCNKWPDIPYTQQYGGTQEAVLLGSPPPGLDCSSFVQSIYLRALGSLYNLPRVAADQAKWCRDQGQQVTVDVALRTPGALVFKGSSLDSIHHVEMSLGDGRSTIGAHRQGAQPHEVGANPADDPSYWDYGGFLPRISYTTDGGGVVATGTGSPTGAPTPPQFTTGDQIPGYNPDDPFDKMFGDNAWLPVMSTQTDGNFFLSQALSGPRALLNDQPLLPYLKNVFTSTMRSFSSAPNGDLVAWYPDYYGMWGTAATMVIEPIEVRDFTVNWSDDFLVTHQFAVVSSLNGNQFNVATGESGNLGFIENMALFTTGVVNIDIPAVWSALFGLDLSDDEAQKLSSWIKDRFGARPDYQEMPGLVGPKAELFAAIFLFLRQFAYQYSASVPLTFMPEVWPGMLIKIPAFDFQAYVTTVTHQFQFGEGGSFTTDLTIAAPARLSRQGPSSLLGLPVAGGAVR
ncbi:C40 family peptidase [Kitasatospora viridis]|uniref:C40 family peptidase n=1 Tax=Kitasatospora viridis TaxID=281105 RepID=UPI0031DACA3E